MTFIDLFAGAGGLSEGFIRAGFDPLGHVEMDKAACYSLQTRVAFHYLKDNNKLGDYLKYLKGDINRSELYASIPEELQRSVINLAIGPENNQKIHAAIGSIKGKQEVDLLIGGPPCQAYSLVGRARSENGMEDDPRNFLYKEYANYLQYYQPKMFVFENVLGILSAKSGAYLRSMEKLFERKGYKMELFKVDASDFGVLQRRKRVIIIGWKDDFTPVLSGFGTAKKTKNFLVSDLLSDLPSIQAGEGIDKGGKYTSQSNTCLRTLKLRKHLAILTQHTARPHTDQDKEIYSRTVRKWLQYGERLNYNDLPEHLKTHQNRHSFFDRFKVVAPDLPYAHTVVAHLSKDGHYYIHPDPKQNRSISVREAARLQSFPDDYYFEGVKEQSGRTAAFKQIGNAVPPLMAEYIANALSQELSKGLPKQRNASSI